MMPLWVGAQKDWRDPAGFRSRFNALKVRYHNQLDHKVQVTFCAASSNAPQAYIVDPTTVFCDCGILSNERFMRGVEVQKESGKGGGEE